MSRRTLTLCAVSAVVLFVGVLVVKAGSGEPSGVLATESLTAATDATTIRPSAVTTDHAPATTTPAGTTTTPATTSAATTVAPIESEVAAPPPQDADDPAIVARPVPQQTPSETVPPAPPPVWAASRFGTDAGYISTDLGCAADLTAASLDAFFARRLGPVMGWDYQHVYPLGGHRFLWLFQDTFVDQSGAASTLGQSSFVHNSAVVQDGTCFRLLHRGSADRPEAFEPGTGSSTLSTWFWPMGGEVHGGLLRVFWVKMVKDASDPAPPDGLGWHPAQTYLASYDPGSLARVDFRLASNAGVAPIYGYAVVSDASYTYLFGNTFEQNLAREGGYWNGPHSATRMFLARVPLGRLDSPPEYRTASGWTADPAASAPILQRYWAEFPMQPRYLDGQWVATSAVNGYWGDWLSVDVARDPWGPWTTVEARPLPPRNADARANTYHAYPMPWRDWGGNLVVMASNNARDMRRDAWPHPDLYRPTAFASTWVVAPPRPPPTTTTTTSTTSTTSTTTSTVATTTTVPATTLAATPSTTSTTPSSTTTTTTVPASSSTSTTSIGSTTTTSPDAD